MIALKNDVLKLLKSGALLSAKQIEVHFNLLPDPKQKPVRSAIDALRARDEPIWNDKDKDAFWWSDKYPVMRRGVKSRWKRTYIE